MQRLFSTFANGWPGRGLLLLRVITAAALIYQGGAAFHDGPRIGSIPQLAGAFVATLILIGLWTPVAAALIALVEVWIALSRCLQSEDPGSSIILAAVAAALAMLGPGARSLDARLFGRKHIDLL